MAGAMAGHSSPPLIEGEQLLFRIEGKVVEEYGFPSVEVVKMERLAFRGDERYGD